MADVNITSRYIDQASSPIVQSTARMIGAFQAVAKTTAPAFNTAGNILSGFGSTVGKVMGRVGSVISKVVGGAIDWIKGLGEHMKWASFFITTALTGIASGFVDMAMGLEQTRNGFTFLLKDQPKVQDALSFIKRWALETPFSVTETTDAFKRFLAVTGDLDKTKALMQSLGDAVVATGGNVDEFNFAARAMSQIMSMSKVRAQEMYQLVNANIPAFDILAKAVQNGKLKLEGFNGASLTDIKEALQDIGTLGISGSEAAQVFMEYFQEAYGGAALQATSTLKGQLGMLKDQIVYTASAVLGYNQETGETYGIYAKLSSAIQQINKFLAEHSDMFKRLGDILSNDNIQWSLIGVAIGAAMGFILGILAPILEVMAVFGLLGFILGKVIDSFGGMEVVVKNLTDFWNSTLYPALQLIWSFLVAQFTPVIEAFKKSWEEMQPKIDQLIPVLQKIGEIFTMVLAVIVILIAQALIGLANILPTVLDLFNWVSTAVQDAWNVLQKLWDIIITAISPSLDSLKGSLQKLWDSFQQLWNLLSPYIIPILKDLWERIKDQIGIWASLAGGILLAAGAIVTGITNALTKIIEIVVNTFSGIVNLVSDFFGLFKNIWEGNWNGVLESIGKIAWDIIGIWDNLKTSVLDIVNSFIQGIFNFFNSIDQNLLGGKIGEVINSIRNRFQGLIDSAWTWGKDLANQFINGIKNLIPGWNLLGGFNISSLFPSEQHGGIIPGPVGAPIPILAHGGERVIPQSGVNNNAGGPVNINFYGGQNFNDQQQRNSIMNEIVRMIGRNNELSMLGAT